MKKYLFLLFASAALMFSCQSDEVTPDNPVDNGPEVAFGINGASLDVVTTKADPQEIITQNAAIGLYRLEKNTYTADNNNEFYYDAGSAGGGSQEEAGWYPKSTTEADDDNIYLNNNNATICAYYPYKADAAPTVAATSIEFVLTPDKYDLSATDPNHSNDLCFLKTPIIDASNTSASKTIALNHAYSRITFIFTRDASYTGTGELTKISMQDLVADSKTIISKSGTVDIAKSSDWYTQVATLGAEKLEFTESETLPAHDVAEAEKLKLSYLMVPATATPADTDQVEFIFTVDDTALETTLTGANLASLALLADKNYKVQVNIKGNDLEITQVTSVPWEDLDVSGELDPQYEP